ncbi:1-acyl-sn-glycerol-3-phosphate acyltransferase [Candidatus Neptunochlamydia vexilliferae]|uniref:1-acyl-sn-glycerol-3-phosphate acyltransferase n=1 Tax=Candidatus Neptunichlamydia vexilliferae TaxID=1651774 RepID=UPI001891190F|nr:lysophospholipid acyltransferase family protein [Candidatus Neptunochlamydia vexilliferae]
MDHYPVGSALIAANHVSFLDPPAVAISCPGEVHFLARRSLFKSYFGKLIAALNTHPVQQEATNLRVMKDVCLMLKKGDKVLMFPEGTRSRDNILKEIKPGIGLLLSRSESVILPTYIHGTYEAWSRDQKLPKLWGKTAVIFGSPIDWKDYADMDRKEAQELIAQKLTETLNGLRKWYEEGAEGIPP